MRLIALIGPLILSLVSTAQTARSIHFKSVLVDTHNDVLTELGTSGKDIAHRISTGHSDLDRWKEGGLDVQFFSIWTGDKARNKEGFYKDANQQIDSLERLTLRAYDRMMLCNSYRDV